MASKGKKGGGKKKLMSWHTWHTRGGKDPRGECVWKYTKGKWVMVENACKRGYEAGSPPRGKGTYEGQHKCTPCERKAKTKTTAKAKAKGKGKK